LGYSSPTGRSAQVGHRAERNKKGVGSQQSAVCMEKYEGSKGARGGMWYDTLTLTILKLPSASAGGLVALGIWL